MAGRISEDLFMAKAKNHPHSTSDHEITPNEFLNPGKKPKVVIVDKERV